MFSRARDSFWPLRRCSLARGAVPAGVGQRLAEVRAQPRDLTAVVHHKRYDIVEAGEFAVLAGHGTVKKLVGQRIEVRRHFEAAITELDASSAFNSNRPCSAR